MTNQQLAYFLAAAAYGSFSAAADALHLAQPSLSEQVRRLEDELGLELFARTTRGLTLTEAGRTQRAACPRRGRRPGCGRGRGRRGPPPPPPASPCSRCASC